jgi:hypothetical protein
MAKKIQAYIKLQVKAARPTQAHPLVQLWVSTA